MQFAHAAQPSCFPARLMQAGLAPVGQAGVPAQNDSRRKLDCGWFDSSFDLAQGLDVMEQDNDALYHLWQLARR